MASAIHFFLSKNHNGYNPVPLELSLRGLGAIQVLHDEAGGGGVSDFPEKMKTYGSTLLALPGGWMGRCRISRKKSKLRFCFASLAPKYRVLFTPT